MRHRPAPQESAATLPSSSSDVKAVIAEGDKRIDLCGRPVIHRLQWNAMWSTHLSLSQPFIERRHHVLQFRVGWIHRRTARTISLSICEVKKCAGFKTTDS